MLAHAYRRLGDLDFPSAQRVAARLALRVGDRGGAAQGPLDDLAAESRKKMAGVTSGVALDEEERAVSDPEKLKKFPRPSGREPLLLLASKE